MADIKVTGMAAVTAITADDVLYVVDDPGGTPVSRKITADDFYGTTTAVPFDVYFSGVGVGLTGGTALLGTAHVRTASAAATVHTSADDLVVENSGHTGISILSGNASTGNLYFADDGDTDAGGLIYSHFSSYMDVRSGGQLVTRVKGAVGVRIELAVSGDPTDLFHVAAAGDANAIVVEDATGDVGFGVAAPGASVDLNRTATGSIIAMRIKNAATSGASSARLQISTVAGSTGDAYIRLDVDGQTWSHGLDQSNGKFTINDATQPGSNDIITCIPTTLDVGINELVPVGKLHVNQDSLTGAKPVLTLEQIDQDVEMIDFIGTTGANATATISTHTTSGAVVSHLQVTINGTKQWVAILADPSA